MMTISPAFDGKPFIFFSYPHENCYRAMQILTLLQKEGFRVWYDYYINPGDPYNSVIEARVRECAIIIPALSIEYCHSDYCAHELVFAREAFEKPVIPIYLDPPKELQQHYTHGIGLWLSGQNGFILDKDSDLSVLKKKIHEIEILFPCNQAYDKVFEHRPQTQADNTPGHNSSNKLASAGKHRSFNDYLIESNQSTGQKNTHKAVIYSLLRVVQKNIQEESFDEAEGHLSDIFQEDPMNADAQYYHLLVKYRVKSPEDLENLTIPLDPADVRATARLQDEKRRKILMNALTQNQKYQQYLIASSHMTAGKYDLALAILLKIPDYSDASDKIIECRERIEHDKLLARYVKEIGDGKNYLSNKLKEAFPEHYRNYAQLCKKTAHAPSKGLVFLICAILLAATGAGMFMAPSSKLLYGVSIALSIALGVLVSFAYPIAGICSIAVLIFLLFMFKSVLGVFLCILAILSLATSITEWRSYKEYEKSLAEKHSYYEKNIREFEENVCREVDFQYAGLLPGERKSLESIDISLTNTK